MLKVEGITANLARDVDDVMRPSELVQEWLSTCVSQHELCRKPFHGKGDIIEQSVDHIPPRRLIQTFEFCWGVKLPKRRLVEDAFLLRAPYVALSHCWGSTDKRPLCTTRDNFAMHRRHMAWHQFPQTFQDAIQLCMEISIQYLWIDSLCIIQDDEDDWRLESANMANIYERALFTIAASSAVNSTEGLFKVRKSLNLVEIPYNDPEGERTDPVLFFIEPDLGKCLSTSPLNQRAWVMQEYFLSRRTVHLTTQGIIWSCKNGKRPHTRHMTSEFGSSWEEVFEDEWSRLVQSYTRRELTYKSDKLVAIEGLATRFQSRGEESGYRQGLFERHMPHDLLWYGEGRLLRDVGNGIPSWSWASTTGPISFKASVFENAETFHAKIAPRSYRDFEVKENLPFDSILYMNALVRRIDNLEGPLQCQAFCYEDVQDMGFSGRMYEDYKNGSINVAPTFALLSAGKKVGWGVFDEHGKSGGDVFCLPLMKQRVWEGFALSKEPHFLWALLVSPAVFIEDYRGMDGCEWYQRVGWGLHFVPSWFDELIVRDICLV